MRIIHKEGSICAYTEEDIPCDTCQKKNPWVYEIQNAGFYCMDCFQDAVNKEWDGNDSDSVMIRKVINSEHKHLRYE